MLHLFDRGVHLIELLKNESKVIARGEVVRRQPQQLPKCFLCFWIGLSSIQRIAQIG